MATIILKRLAASAARALHNYNVELLAQQATASFSTTPALDKKKKCMTPLDKAKAKAKKCKKKLKKCKLEAKCKKLAARKKKSKKSCKGKKKK